MTIIKKFLGDKNRTRAIKSLGIMTIIKKFLANK